MFMGEVSIVNANAQKRLSFSFNALDLSTVFYVMVLLMQFQSKSLPFRKDIIIRISTELQFRPIF